MIKYRTVKNSSEIKATEVIGETPKFVLGFDGMREAKRSCWQCWHDTWEDAHQFLLEQAERELNSARLVLQKAQGEYGNIKGMKKPEEAK